MSLAATVAPLVAYAVVFQTLVYMSIPAPRRVRLAPLVTGVTGAGLAAVAGLLFGFETIGLTGGDPGVAALAGVAAVVFASLAGVGLLSQPRWRSRLADPRVAELGRWEAVAHILVRIPVFTAFTEELFFRGVLHAALITLYPVDAALLIGAAAFGLWHIGPGLDQSRGAPAPARVGAAIHTSITVLATTVAGLFLLWLRVETGSIWAPVAVHAAINMTLAVFARRASRPGVESARDSLHGWKRISEVCSFAWRER
ncbi:MAG TPA: CPBP family intramembrane glutamic endopeptidase [Acidimicrobiia bacterium]|nr:CPBP family intramembrane glutamic endopeptidase [Acidimicrobiia bacterium]